jgi:hypothetical protein
LKRTDLIKIIVPVMGAVFFYGCAKPAISPGADERPTPLTRKKDVFLTVKFDIAPLDNAWAEFQKKALGEWRDFLYLIENNYEKTPLNISLSVNVINFLKDIEENNFVLDPAITLPPSELNDAQKEYLVNKYDLKSGTVSLVKGQILEAAGYMGRTIHDTETYEGFLHISTYTAEAKSALIELMSDELGNFNQLLKKSLQSKYRGEATTALSDSYLPLLDAGRTKVQILEGLVAYKKWRGDFPAGFLPKGGYITDAGIKEIEKTGIEWIIVKSTKSIETQSLNTSPMVVYTLPGNLN